MTPNFFPFAVWLCSSSHQEVESISPPLIWAGFVTHFGPKNMVEVTNGLPVPRPKLKRSHTLPFFLRTLPPWGYTLANLLENEGLCCSGQGHRRPACGQLSSKHMRNARQDQQSPTQHSADARCSRVPCWDQRTSHLNCRLIIVSKCLVF